MFLSVAAVFSYFFWLSFILFIVICNALIWFLVSAVGGKGAAAVTGSDLVAAFFLGTVVVVWMSSYANFFHVSVAPSRRCLGFASVGSRPVPR